MAKFCENCGTKYEEGTKFCSGCGKELPASSGFIDLDNAEIPQQSNNVPVAVQNSPSSEVSYTSSAPADAIVLKSSAPIPSKTGWTRWGYIISLFLLAANGFGIITGAFVFIADNLIMRFHRDKIRKMKFKFVDNVSADEIYNKLQPELLKKYGNKMDFDREGDTISVIYDKIAYDINVNGDGTVGIWWRKPSIMGALFGSDWKLYKNIRKGTSIVAYELQSVFNVK